ncbi:MAG: PIG-L deacetylase family protein [Planctomycetia bacterium]|nr:PIG-L deacetylase family protein [Planctomycetia bacterium]
MFEKSNVIYDRRVNAIVERAAEARIIFPQWKAGKESWLFVAAHDDDVVTGACLTLLAALEEKVQVHVVITANGCMGYCDSKQRDNIVDIRKGEAIAAYKELGLPENNIHFLGFDDCSLYLNAGRRFADKKTSAPVVEKATGLQNSFTSILRQVRPTRVFVPTVSDIHPDHQLTTKEFLISIFHAQGTIWPELGSPIDEIPLIYEYSTYSDFPTPPTMRIRTAPALLEKKLNAIKAFASQTQIDILIENQKASGAQEFLREVVLDILAPHKYDKMFD